MGEVRDPLSDDPVVSLCRWLCGTHPDGFAPGWAKILPDGAMAFAGNCYAKFWVGDMLVLSCYVPFMVTERFEG